MAVAWLCLRHCGGQCPAYLHVVASEGVAAASNNGCNNGLPAWFELFIMSASGLQRKLLCGYFSLIWSYHNIPSCLVLVIKWIAGVVLLVVLVVTQPRPYNKSHITWVAGVYGIMNTSASGLITSIIELRLRLGQLSH